MLAAHCATIPVAFAASRAQANVPHRCMHLALRGMRKGHHVGHPYQFAFVAANFGGQAHLMPPTIVHLRRPIHIPFYRGALLIGKRCEHPILLPEGRYTRHQDATEVEVAAQ